MIFYNDLSSYTRGIDPYYNRILKILKFKLIELIYLQMINLFTIKFEGL